MEPGTDASASPRVWAALAGFEAGMAGGLVLLLGVGLASSWYRGSFWGPANIMASTFYGDDAIGRGFSWNTLSGIAVYLILYSLFGALFGAAMHRSGWSRGRLTLLGMLAGLAWYYFCFSLLWKYANPLIPLYTHDRPMFWGHLVYGAMLGRFPVYFERLTAVLAKPAPTPEPVPPMPSPEPAAPDTEPAVQDSTGVTD